MDSPSIVIFLNNKAIEMLFMINNHKANCTLINILNLFYPWIRIDNLNLLNLQFMKLYFSRNEISK